MTVDKRWSAFWIALGALGLGGELVALAVDGPHDTLSAQVWYALDWSPWLRTVVMALFGAGFAWLTVHFFGHRRSRDA